MKTIFYLAAVALLMAACQPKDVGAEHAVEFVREQVPEMAQSIESIEVTGVDTLLGLMPLIYSQVEVPRKNVEFWENKITAQQYRAFIDSMVNVANDIDWSWRYGSVVNDSLRKLEKYQHCWRRVYNVCVTMKSGVVKTPRVLMDKDGITPFMLEREVGKEIQKFTNDLIQGNDDILDREFSNY